jgi:predicted ArsR family transcriptional regulator
MAKASVRRSKKQKILQLCNTPIRFTDLKKKVRITDAGLAKNLKAFQTQGWLQKNQEGKYELTAAGRITLTYTQRTDTVQVNLKTSPILVENTTVNHLGLEGADGESLLSDIAQAIRLYLSKHSDKPILVTVEYSGPRVNTNV